jgi:integrase
MMLEKFVGTFVGTGSGPKAIGIQNMARMMGRLTALKVTRIANQPGLYADGGGLYLQVTTGGASWLYRYMLRGRPREMGLGPLAVYGLQEARAKAHESRQLRHEGIDPIDARRAARTQAKLEAAKAITFKQCAESYIQAHRPSWRSAKHAAQWEATLATYAEPIIGMLPVQAVDTTLVMQILEQEVAAVPGQSAAALWIAKPETASRVRGRIESILDWAKVRGYREGENPARWRGHLAQLLPARAKVKKVQHHAALPYADVSDFMTELRAQEGVAARALEFAILTAARSGETIGARWNEINILEKIWIIPAERMKAGKEHRVPLSNQALILLENLETEEVSSDDFVFSGGKHGKPLSNMAMAMTLRRMKRGDLTVHGFRSTFRDWAAERTNYPSEIPEMTLYALLIVRLGRRDLVWINVTTNPTAEWIARQLTEAFPWDEAPRYLIRDRDRIYGSIVTRRMRAMGIRDKHTAPASPWQNGFAERLIGSIRRECMDHFIVLGEAHLRRILRAYAGYYNSIRTHWSLDKDAPVSRSVQRTGIISSRPILGGLHHHYVRV